MSWSRLLHSFRCLHEPYQQLLRILPQQSTLVFLKKRPQLGCFLYDNRRLQNFEELHVKSIESGKLEPPVKHHEADDAIASKKRLLQENADEILLPAARKGKFIRRLYQLGKLAGMGAELKKH